MPEHRQQKNNLQLIWGVILLIIGVAVFFRTTQVMPKLQELNYTPITLVFIRICFYLMGIILAGGGARKIFLHFFVSPSSELRPERDTDMNSKNG